MHPDSPPHHSTDDWRTRRGESTSELARESRGRSPPLNGRDLSAANSRWSSAQPSASSSVDHHRPFERDRPPRFPSTSRQRSLSPPSYAPSSSSAGPGFPPHPRRQHHQWESSSIGGGGDHPAPSPSAAAPSGPPQLSLALPQRPNFSPSGSRRFNDHRDRERTISAASPLNPNAPGIAFPSAPHGPKSFVSGGGLTKARLGEERDVGDLAVRERSSGGPGPRRRDWHPGADGYRDRDSDPRTRPPRAGMYDVEPPKVEWDYYDRDSRPDNLPPARQPPPHLPSAEPIAAPIWSQPSHPRSHSVHSSHPSLPPSTRFPPPFASANSRSSGHPPHLPARGSSAAPFQNYRASFPPPREERFPILDYDYPPSTPNSAPTRSQAGSSSARAGSFGLEGKSISLLDRASYRVSSPPRPAPMLARSVPESRARSSPVRAKPVSTMSREEYEDGERPEEDHEREEGQVDDQREPLILQHPDTPPLPPSMTLADVTSLNNTTFTSSIPSSPPPPSPPPLSPLFPSRASPRIPLALQLQPLENLLPLPPKPSSSAIDDLHLSSSSSRSVDDSPPNVAPTAEENKMKTKLIRSPSLVLPSVVRQISPSPVIPSVALSPPTVPPSSPSTTDQPIQSPLARPSTPPRRPFSPSLSSAPKVDVEMQDSSFVLSPPKLCSPTPPLAPAVEPIIDVAMSSPPQPPMPNDDSSSETPDVLKTYVRLQIESSSVTLPHLIDSLLASKPEPVSAQLPADEAVSHVPTDPLSFPLPNQNVLAFARSRQLAAIQQHALRVATLQSTYKTLDAEWQTTCARLSRISQKLRYSSQQHSRYPSTPLGSTPLAGLPLFDDGARTSRASRSSRANPAESIIGAGGGYFADAVRSEAEFQSILASLEDADSRDPNLRAARTTAVVPDMVLNGVRGSGQGGRGGDAWDDNNGLVRDPLAFYLGAGAKAEEGKWEDEEKETFVNKFAAFPKQFGKIASHLPHKSSAACVLHYYLSKKSVDYRGIVASRGTKRRGGRRGGGKGSALLKDLNRKPAGAGAGGGGKGAKSKPTPANAATAEDELPGGSGNGAGTTGGRKKRVRPPVETTAEEDANAVEPKRAAAKRRKKFSTLEESAASASVPRKAAQEDADPSSQRVVSGGGRKKAVGLGRLEARHASPSGSLLASLSSLTDANTANGEANPSPRSSRASSITLDAHLSGTHPSNHHAHSPRTSISLTSALSRSNGMDLRTLLNETPSSDDTIIDPRDLDRNFLAKFPEPPSGTSVVAAPPLQIASPGGASIGGGGPNRDRSLYGRQIGGNGSFGSPARAGGGANFPGSPSSGVAGAKVAAGRAFQAGERPFGVGGRAFSPSLPSPLVASAADDNERQGA